MNKADLKKYEKLLIAKRDELMEQLQIRKKQIDTTIKDATGDISSYSYHMADQGTDAMEREKAFLFLSREEKYLQQIDRSLHAIELGEYGVCRVCNKEIDDARLKAVPTTRICVPCKQAEARRK